MSWAAHQFEVYAVEAHLPKKMIGPDQLVRDLLRRLHPRLPRQVLGLRLQLQRPPLRRGEAVPVAPRLARHGHQPHALLRSARLPRHLGLEAQPGLDDRVPARVRRARAHRRERQHRHDAAVPVLDPELEPAHLGVRGHGQGRQVPRRGRVLQQPRLRDGPVLVLRRGARVVARADQGVLADEGRARRPARVVVARPVARRARPARPVPRRLLLRRVPR